jgi:hypothetical protein
MNGNMKGNMRRLSFALVPLFAATTYALLHPREPRSASAQAQTAGEIDKASVRHGPGAAERGVRLASTRAAALPVEPIVDLQSYSDLDLALIEASGPARGALAVTRELVNSRIRRLMNRAKEFCQARELDPASGARSDHQKTQELTESRVQVSVWIEAGGPDLRLSKITVTPWQGAALTSSFGDCLQQYALAHAASPDLARGQQGIRYATFAGGHRILVNLQTTCAATVASPPP